MTRVIELNDVALRLADRRGLQASSPAYAIVDEQRLIVGPNALQQARLDPRHTTNRFWHWLSMDPVPHPHPSARTLADLAHAHLLELWSSAPAQGDATDVIFVVPGTLGREQLALLLGIARACPFRPVGLVDAALAATAWQQPDSNTVVHVDALLHTALLTLIEGTGTTWRRTEIIDLPALGIASLREAWINVIADTFVRETRFDPLHDAHTEQSLCNRLDGWLDALTRAPELELELQVAAQIYRVTVTRARLVQKIAPRLQQLADELARALQGPARILLSHRLARLPGVVDLLAERFELALELSAADAPLKGALAEAKHIRHDTEALPCITELPRKNPATATGPEQAKPAGPDPVRSTAATTCSGTTTAKQSTAAEHPVTHVLLGHRAWPLAGERIQLGGPGGLDSERLPAHLGTLEHRQHGWYLLPAQDDAADLPPMVPGEARLLGPAHILVALIKVEQG